jgi:hypothetical protein
MRFTETIERDGGRRTAPVWRVRVAEDERECKRCKRARLSSDAWLEHEASTVIEREIPCATQFAWTHVFRVMLWCI